MGICNMNNFYEQCGHYYSKPPFPQISNLKLHWSTKSQFNFLSNILLTLIFKSFLFSSRDFSKQSLSLNNTRLTKSCPIATHVHFSLIGLTLGTDHFHSNSLFTFFWHKLITYQYHWQRSILQRTYSGKLVCFKLQQSLESSVVQTLAGANLRVKVLGVHFKL